MSSRFPNQYTNGCYLGTATTWQLSCTCLKHAVNSYAGDLSFYIFALQEEAIIILLTVCAVS